MRKLLSTIMLIASASSALASGFSRKASEQEVIAAAKQLSSSDCTPPKGKDGLLISGCEYSAAFLQGQWSVRVSVLYIGPNGAAAYTPGGDFLYLFQADGKFIERSRGM